MTALKPKSLYEFESECLIGYWVKGHCDIDDFCKAVKEFEKVEINPDQVKHEFWRVVVNQIVLAQKPGKGAFAVTFVEI